MKANQCLIGIATEIAKAIAAIETAMEISEGEGTEVVAAGLTAARSALEKAMMDNIKCGRAFAEEKLS